MGLNNLYFNKHSRQFSCLLSLRPSALDFSISMGPEEGEIVVDGDVCLWTISKEGIRSGHWRVRSCWVLGGIEVLEWWSGAGMLKTDLPKPDLILPMPTRLGEWALRSWPGFRFDPDWIITNAVSVLAKRNQDAHPSIIHPFFQFKVYLFELMLSELLFCAKHSAMPLACIYQTIRDTNLCSLTNFISCDLTSTLMKISSHQISLSEI